MKVWVIALIGVLFLIACTRDPAAQGAAPTRTVVPLPTHTAIVPIQETATARAREYPNSIQAQRILIADILFDQMAIADPQRLWGGGDVEEITIDEGRRRIRVVFGYNVNEQRYVRTIREQAIAGLASAVCDIRVVGVTDYMLSITVFFHLDDGTSVEPSRFQLNPLQLQQLNCDAPLLNRLWTEQG